jgi:hypothetical protein
MRRVLKAIASGQDVGDLTTLENEASVDRRTLAKAARSAMPHGSNKQNFEVFHSKEDIPLERRHIQSNAGPRLSRRRWANGPVNRALLP